MPAALKNPDNTVSVFGFMGEHIVTIPNEFEQLSPSVRCHIGDLYFNTITNRFEEVTDKDIQEEATVFDFGLVIRPILN